MILPVVRERFEALLRQPALQGVVSALQGGAKTAGCVGLTELAKAIAVAYVTSQLRRPAFLVVDSNKKAEAIAETLRFCFSIFPGSTGGVAVLPAFDTYPWESRSPHADILERRAATLYRLAAGETSLVIAPVASVLCRYRAGTDYAELTRVLEKDADVPLQDFLAHLGATGYARTEMVELPGQFAVRGGIVDIFSPEAPRPVRVELLGDTVESVREFDPRTQRSIAPVNRTVVLPLTEWQVAREAGADPWPLPPYWGLPGAVGVRSLFELAASSLEPLIFVNEPAAVRTCVAEVLREVTESYEKLGAANSPDGATFFWTEEEFDLALELATRVDLEQLGLAADEATRFHLASRPSTRFHGEVVACVGDVKSQLAEGGTVFLTAASTGELERFADICREYEVPYVLGESESAAAGFTAESASEAGRAGGGGARV